MNKKIIYGLVAMFALFISVFFFIAKDNEEVRKDDFNKTFYGDYTEEEIVKIKKQPASEINALILAMYYTRNIKTDIPQKEFWTEMCSFYVGNLGTCIKSNIVDSDLEDEVSKSVMIGRAKFKGEKIDFKFNDKLTEIENKIIYAQPLTPVDLNIINNSPKKCYYLHIGARNKDKDFIKMLLNEIENYKRNKASCYNELVSMNNYFKIYIDKYTETIAWNR